MKINFIKKEIDEGDLGYCALVPVSEIDVAKVNKLNNGEFLEADVKKERNFLLLKKYWSLCYMVASNKKADEFLEGLNTKELVDEYVKIKTGLIKGKIVFEDSCPHCQKSLETVHAVTDSISYKKMTEEKFSRWYNSSISILAELIDVSTYDLENNWMSYDSEIE